MSPLIFWGATGQAKVLREALSGNNVELIALFDNRDIPSPFPGIPVFQGERGFADWERIYGGEHPVRACVAIGGTHGNDRLVRTEWLSDHGYPPLGVVHPRAFVAANAELGEGCQVLAMSTICAGVKLGRAVIVNTKASIDHDCVIGDGVHIAPGATITGEVVIGDCAFIGAGAVILPRVRVGEDAIVGAGAIVTRDVAANETVVGNPARPYHKDPS